MPTDRRTLPKRVRLARAALPFCAVSKRMKDGRARVIAVPGSRGRRYSVFLKRGPLLEVECRLNFGALGLGDHCRGNGIHTLCRHAITGVLVAASEANMDIAWCATYSDALRRSRLGMYKIMQIVNELGGHLFAVVERSAL